MAIPFTEERPHSICCFSWFHYRVFAFTIDKMRWRGNADRHQHNVNRDIYWFLKNIYTVYSIQVRTLCVCGLLFLLTRIDSPYTQIRVFPIKWGSFVLFARWRGWCCAELVWIFPSRNNSKLLGGKSREGFFYLLVFLFFFFFYFHSTFYILTFFPVSFSFYTFAFLF